MGFYKGDTEDRSWEAWLLWLKEDHERERVDIKMDLVARLFVTERSDRKN
jgi:hypothetical protein